jgi:hypothetical protein
MEEEHKRYYVVGGSQRVPTSDEYGGPWLAADEELSDFEDAVQVYLDDGWKLAGGVSTLVSDKPKHGDHIKVYFYQAVYRD